ncbi:MAG: acetate--CoA ligase family protein [Myxococcota bacterium]
MNAFFDVPDLRAFFAPSSVALVGATEDPSRFGGRCLHRLLNFGYRGRVFPVNPGYRELRGLPCYPNVRDLPVAPDHVGIAAPAAQIPAILEDCAARGVRFATVFSGGFAETATDEGRARQAALVAFARANGMRLMGPNCNGLVNFIDGFALTSSGSVAGPRQPPGNIGIVAQSGGLGQVAVMWRAQELGLGVSYEASCGNSADLDAFDFADFMVDDAHTDVILMVMEHIADGARLLATARRAAEREKPIVMLKLGRTVAGARAAASHTGALAGADAVIDAALRQCGVLRVDDCNELYETAMLLRTRRWPRGTRAAAATISGGNGVLIVDLGASLGIQWPEYDEATKARLKRCLPPHGTTANPTDVTNVAIGKPGIYRDCITAIADDANVDMVIPMLTLAAAADVREVAQAAQAAAKPVAVLWTGGCVNDAAVSAREFIAAGVPVYRNTLGCLKAVRAAMHYGEFLGHAPRDAIARPPGTDAARARQLLDGRKGPLTERASKEVLAAYGFPAAREALARSAEEAVRLCRGHGGAVALKIESPDIPHKTEAGGVRLGLDDEAAVRAAC